nr:hypothetical protein [Bacteroidota bacterium]
MEKILGIDLGTNSIGLTLRENNEFTWYGVYTFRKGVGEGKSGEFSYAAERTKHRSSRRLCNARRYRKWGTLKVLIENGFCPLDIEKLDKWKHYEKGIGRVFPIDDKGFQRWIKLDLNGNDSPDFSSPYQLRRLLIEKKLDLAIPENKHIVGRALYHIAQRRGFKSSRKQGANGKTSVYKGSNETKTIGRDKYEELIIKHGSLGAAFAYLEDEGIRVRNRYTLRSDYRDEVNKILEFQEIQNKAFKDKLLLESKNGSIFYQRPLRSQKGLIGKCTLEPNKPRCPVSHPKFEEYRAWSFINNIKYRTDKDARFEPIPLELKEKLYHAKFFYKSSGKREFDFIEVRKFIESNGGNDWELNYSKKMDKVSVSSCYVSARLKSVFGQDWQNFEKKVSRKNKKGEDKVKTYNIEDIWHLLFSFEDEEYFEEFLIKTLGLNEDQIKELKMLFNSFPVGYANLSLKAINNILPFLKQGLIYTEAVILAKIPEIISKEVFEANKEIILNTIKDEIETNRHQKKIITITNNLIFKYYALDYQNRFGWKDTSYKLDKSDLKDVETATIEHFGNKSWIKLIQYEKDQIINEVAAKYQVFFASAKREHIKPPHLVNQIKEFLDANFNISERLLDKIYHPSQINIYPKKEGQQFLLSPRTAAFKNPMAYKTLYRLRDVINYLIETEIIDEETRMVVEIARDLNDSNKRWSIEKYQRDREAENREFANAISDLINDPNFSGIANPESKDDVDKVRLLLEQTDEMQSDEELELRKILRDPYKRQKEKNEAQKLLIKKYRLWIEQGMRCMYTGRIIKLTDLFDKNRIDFEHTIPRSKSFDNSLANLTVCDADYNRKIKKNRMPTELENYENDAHGYSAIKPRLYAWKKKVEHLFNQIDLWKTKSKNAKDKAEKDNAIRTRHLWQMEYDYWKNKLDRFTRTEIPQGFVNSQLTDTQIITKYAFHYLKTVFNNVDVIKGNNTAQFRRIYEIQPKDEVKDRGKHYHHAIDAAVLTLIPSSRLRQEILGKAYLYEEKNWDKQYHEKPFKGFNYSMIEEIKKNILINNIADKDQTLTLGKKIDRNRGRIVWLKDRDGKFLLDNNGNKIPKIAQGDSIRGELHQQTFYGKIRVVDRDENGVPLRDENGGWKFLSKNKEFKYALRIPIENLKGLDKIVDPHLAKMIEAQLNGRSLKKAIGEGIHMLDVDGNKVNQIRRIRVWQSVNPIPVKEQTYKSSKVYKNYYYAKNAENYAFAYYRNDSGDIAVIPINLYQVSTFNDRNSINDIRDLFEYKVFNKKGVEIPLFHVFVPGQKVIFYENDKKELKSISNLSNYLYFVRRLYQANRGNIQFQHHLEARDDKQLLIDFPTDMIAFDNKRFGKRGVNGFLKFETDFVAPRLLLSPGNFNFIIEEKDFEMKLDGSIEFKF